jgi:hypothetical protein
MGSSRRDFARKVAVRANLKLTMKRWPGAPSTVALNFAGSIEFRTGGANA